MGACIGKKSFKYLKRKRPQSEVIQAPQPKTEDGASENKSPSSQSKKLPLKEDCPINNDDECRTSKIDQISIDSEVQIIIGEQKTITETFSKPFPSRFVSMTESELEDELAKFIIENPENDHVENSPDVKCTDTR